MDRDPKRDIRLINIAGALGTVYYRLALAEILLLFVTRCLGISKETWALVAALLPVTSGFNILSAYLAERIRRRKLLSLTCFAVSRLAVPAMILLPFVITGPGEDARSTRLFFLAAALIAHSSITAVGASAWLSWVADIVPSGQRGTFYSIRLIITTIFDVVLFLGGGWLLDVIARARATTPGEPNYADPWGYVVIFGIAFLAGERNPIEGVRAARAAIDASPELAEAWWALGLAGASKPSLTSTSLTCDTVNCSSFARWISLCFLAATLFSRVEGTQAHLQPPAESAFGQRHGPHSLRAQQPVQGRHVRQGDDPRAAGRCPWA